MTRVSVSPAAKLPCPHTPACPAADAPDHDAAVTVTSFPIQGWSRKCNGVIVFHDTGELVGTTSVAVHRPEPMHRPAVIA